MSWRSRAGCCWGTKRASKFQKPVSTYLYPYQTCPFSTGRCIIPVGRHLFKAHLEEDLTELMPYFVHCMTSASAHRSDPYKALRTRMQGAARGLGAHCFEIVRFQLDSFPCPAVSRCQYLHPATATGSTYVASMSAVRSVSSLTNSTANFGPFSTSKLKIFCIMINFRFRRSSSTLGSGCVRVCWMICSCSRLASWTSFV